MKIYKSSRTSLRIDPQNPDHHLYNNNGTWWIHYTIYPDHLTARRIRRSLGTPHLGIARDRRDFLLQSLISSSDKSWLCGHLHHKPEPFTGNEVIAG